MRYLVETIANYICENALQTEDESLFAVNGFEDLEIYEQLCKTIKQKVESNSQKTLKIKLANKKWNHFKEKYAGSPLLHSMQQNDWLANGQSTTYYRNLHDSDILILLATEEEEDAVGSLNEITTITPAFVIELIEKDKGKIQYHSIFNFTDLFNDLEKKAVDNLYKDLFEFVTPDIVKLSALADKWEGEVSCFYDFINLFFAELPSWGLPYKKDSLPKISEINSNKNVLRQEFNFINGTLFSPFSLAKYNSYKKKLEKYDEDQKKYSSIWSDWDQQSIKNYDQYSDILLKYIRGDKTNITKNQLMTTDFSIAEDVLGLKLEKNVRVVGEKIYGDPLTAFTKAIIDIMTDCRNDDADLAKIEFEFHNADIVSENDDDENLAKQWNNICVHTNGVFNYIKEFAMFAYREESIDIACSPKDYFEITMDTKDYVKKARGNKTTNKISFKTVCYNSNGEIVATSPTKDCEWLFKYSEEWINSFTDLCSQEFVKTTSPLIPVSTNSFLKSLVLAKSKDDFFQILDDESDTIFDCNLLNGNEYSTRLRNHNLYPRFLKLGTNFANFAHELSTDGLFNVLANSNRKDTLFQLLESYKGLGRNLLKTSINDNEKYLLNFFVHAFNIEENTGSVLLEKDIDYCIVPPWHPASLEKIKHMYLFFMDGCHEYWNEIDKSSNSANKSVTEEKIDELCELSIFQNAVDLFPSNDSLYGATRSYGFYTLYSKKNIKADNKFRDLIDREAIYDDDFKTRSYSEMNDDALMIFHVIENYIKAFPDSKDMLNLAFINPSDLQPIIAAINKYIQEFHKHFGDNTNLTINLRVLVKPENMGGKNYLTYWMNETFDVDSNVKIKTFLNVWKNESELYQYLNPNNDIAFIMDLLKEGSYSFNNYDAYRPSKNECYFPIVFRPGLVASTSVNRVIELSQPQFEVATTHTQVVHYRKGFEDPIIDKSYLAVKSVTIDDEGRRIVNALHEKAYWVVCIDNGLDGSLVKTKDTANQNYSVIGFSTGKGKYGQYNLTITARNSIVTSIQNRFASRLKHMFNWNDELVQKATKTCMDEASFLDGISVLKASNKKDYNINEFMAYVLTALREKELNINSPLKTIVHLDSYKHWFNRKGETKSIFEDELSRSRPDFLILEVSDDYSERVKINATIVECKIAKINNKNQHLKKALGQVQTGLDRLKEIFNPDSQSIKRRYWFAQLYRALAFAQITFEDKNPEYTKIAKRIRMILDGDFEINWNSEILGYWVDLSGTSETCESVDGVNVYNIPQLRIQQLLQCSNEPCLQFNKDIDFVDEFEEAILEKEKQKELEEYRPMNKVSIKSKTESRISKNKGNSEHVPFTFEEATILLSFLVGEKEQGWSTSNTANRISKALRRMAEDQGKQYSDSYRSPDGIVGRLREMSLILEGKENESKTGTRVFDEVVDLYNGDRAQYYKHLDSLSDYACKISRTDNSINNDNVNDDITTIDQSDEEVAKNENVEVGQGNPKKLSDVRVYVGDDRLKNQVFWEFGHPSLANRHLLVTGTSGQGKTYCIQTLLYELSKANISSVIFDYTEGFREDQLEPQFVEKMKDSIYHEIVYDTGVPINPFLRHEINVGGHKMLEKPADVANRIANIFTHVYGFGEQQYSAIFTAARLGLTKYKDQMNMELFRDELEKVKSSNPAAKSVLSKMEPFFYTVEFVDDKDFDWEKVLYGEQSKTHIFQLTNIDRAIQVIITELMLWDAWYFTQKVGSKDKPFVVVLDEAQNLSHKDNSPSAKILTEGRKFGWSAWFATQSLKVLSDDEVVRLMQSSFRIYFKPTDDEITKVSKLIDPTDSASWVGQVKNLTKGKCIVVGDRIKPDGSFGVVKPTVTSVKSFDERD